MSDDELMEMMAGYSDAFDDEDARETAHSIAYWTGYRQGLLARKYNR